MVNQDNRMVKTGKRMRRRRLWERGFVCGWIVASSAGWTGLLIAQDQPVAQALEKAVSGEKPPAQGTPPTGTEQAATNPTGQPPGQPGQPGTPGGPTVPGANPNSSSAPAQNTPISRGAKPPERTNDEAFKVRPDADGKVQFQFEGAPWPAIIHWLSEVTGMAIDWQELPGDFINLKTQQSYTIAETRDLINRHLLSRGYTLLQDGELLVVVKTAGINTGIVPRVEPDQLSECMPHDFVKVSFELEWLLAEDVATELKPMISSNGQLLALKTTNRLEAIDVARNLQQVYDVLSKEQSAESHERQMREFKLEHVRAIHVKDKLEQLLGIASKQSAMPMSPEQQQQMMMMQQQMQQQMQQGGQPQPPRKESEVKIVINEQRNSVLVLSSPDRMVAIAEAVRLLDVPDDRAGSLDQVIGGIRTYRLATLNPKDVVDVLMETGALAPETRLKIDEKSSAIIVSGPPWDHLTVEKLIKKLDGSPRNFKVVRLRRRRADQVATTVENLMVGPQEEDKSQSRRNWYYGDWFGGQNQENKSKDRFRVAADVEHNWLMLWCNESEHERVLELLAQLGEIPDRSANGNQVRVIDSIPAERVDEVLKRVQQAFGPLAPNPVILPQADSSATTDSKTDANSSGSQKPATDPAPAADEVRKVKPASDQSSSIDHPPGESFETPHDETWAPRFVSEDRATIVADRVDSDQAELDETDQAAESNVLDRAAPANARPMAQNQDRPAIHVTRTPDGRVVIHSTDVAALDMFEELLEELQPPKKDYTVFQLKHALASWVRLRLEDYFEEDEEDEDDSNGWRRFFYFDESNEENKKQSLGLADRRPIKFISDIDTNTIVVRNATDDQLAIVAELVELYDVPEPINKDKARHTKLVYVKHSKASKIADQIKDAFRDLLSGNDKAFQQQPQQGGGEQPQRSNGGGGGGMSSGLAFGEGDNKTQSDTQASFKGKLSVGVDDDTNTILLSTDGEKLMQIIVAMITELDRAAQPADDVRVMRLRGGATVRPVQDALRKTLRIQGAAGAPAPGAGEGGEKKPEGQSETKGQPGEKPNANGNGNGNGNGRETRPE